MKYRHRAAGLLWWSVLAAGLTIPVSLPADDGGLPAYSLAYDAQRDPFADGRAALRLAGQNGRRVLIEVGGDWCSWCHALDAFLEQNPALHRRLHRAFVVLKVNVSDANDNAAFLTAFPEPLGYPHMYVTGSDGVVLHSQDTAEFLHEGSYSVQRFDAFLTRWGPP